jgi:acyl-coenzyme A thioesterase 13
MSTTTALCPLARPGHWEFMGGVTRSLAISYLRPVPLRMTVRLRSHVVSVGRTMALIRGVMTSEEGGVTYATAEHHKVNTGVLEGHRKARVEWDSEFEGEWGGKENRGDVECKVKAKM